MRLAPLTGIALLGLTVTGCYTLQRAGGATPPAGQRVAFDVNDAGRSALGGLIGPEVAQIEGRLLSNGTEDYLLAVSTVRLLRGGEQVWSGEQVRIRREHVTTTYERRLSRGRTLALAAVAGGVVAVFVGRSLAGAGSDHPRLPIDTVSTRIVRP